MTRKSKVKATNIGVKAGGKVNFAGWALKSASKFAETAEAVIMKTISEALNAAMKYPAWGGLVRDVKDPTKFFINLPIGEEFAPSDAKGEPFWEISFSKIVKDYIQNSLTNGNPDEEDKAFSTALCAQLRMLADKIERAQSGKKPRR